MKKRDLTKKLSNMGFENVGGSKHEKWQHPEKSGSVSIPRHNEIGEILSKAILKQAKAILES